MLHQDAKSLLCPGLPVSYFGNQLQTANYSNWVWKCHKKFPHRLYIPMYMKTSAVETKYLKLDPVEYSVFLPGNLQKFLGYWISYLITLEYFRTCIIAVSSSRVKGFQYNIIFYNFSEKYENLLFIKFYSYKKKIRFSPWNKITSEDYYCKHSSA